MNTETSLVVALVLAVLVVSILYGAGSEMFEMGGDNLDETQDNISNPDESEKYWLEDTSTGNMDELKEVDYRIEI